ncbi:hypothetical protein EGW08_001600 [Elysia chlorotica]|uniref:Uncharacterized protein n=1 Tax=Elysia chlorotica TaxID=188477 RepID=A0A433U9W8_ELYCH|nr:hypothetical protein EGW08_001600 [Elysia chlorotica]
MGDEVVSPGALEVSRTNGSVLALSFSAHRSISKLSTKTGLHESKSALDNEHTERIEEEEDIQNAGRSSDGEEEKVPEPPYIPPPINFIRTEFNDSPPILVNHNCIKKTFVDFMNRKIGKSIGLVAKNKSTDEKWSGTAFTWNSQIGVGKSADPKAKETSGEKKAKK